MVLWGAVFPWNKAHELEMNSIVLRGKIKAVSTKAEQLKLQYAQLTSEGKSLDLKLEDYKLKKEAIKSKKMKVYIQMIDVQSPVDIELEKLEVLTSAQKTYERIGWASIVSGVLFILLGFTTWYFKIQRYIDSDIAQNK
jgi:hypothetical protein